MRINSFPAMGTERGIAFNQSLTTRTLNKRRYAWVCERSIRLNFHASRKDIILVIPAESKVDVRHWFFGWISLGRKDEREPRIKSPPPTNRRVARRSPARSRPASDRRSSTSDKEPGYKANGYSRGCKDTKDPRQSRY